MFLQGTQTYLVAGECGGVPGPVIFLINVFKCLWFTLQALQQAAPLETAPNASGAAAHAGRFFAPFKPGLCLSHSFYLERSICVFSVSPQQGAECELQQALLNQPDVKETGWKNTLQERDTVIITNGELFNMHRGKKKLFFFPLYLGFLILCSVSIKSLCFEISSTCLSSWSRDE